MSQFTFFYGGVFSQWYFCDIEIDGVKYNCAEQYMMHQKALLFNDQISADLILEANHPKEQKALGRKVKNFDIALWNISCRSYVYKGNYHKFKQNTNLYEYLVTTGDTELVEASPYDVVWGIGIGMTDKRRFDKSNWRGTNWLGKVLTLVREDLKNGFIGQRTFNEL